MESVDRREGKGVPRKSKKYLMIKLSPKGRSKMLQTRDQVKVFETDRKCSEIGAWGNKKGDDDLLLQTGPHAQGLTCLKRVIALPFCS